MAQNIDRLTLSQSKKEIQKVLSVLDLKIIRNPLKKSTVHSQLIHRDLVRNFNHLGVPMHVLVLCRMIEDLNYDNLVFFLAGQAAEEFGTDIPHISKCVKRLEKKGFIVRLWDPNNLKKRVKLWMMNPTVVYRGPGLDYQRSLDNFEALLDSRFDDTEFNRDRSESGLISKAIPWLQGRLDLNFDEASESEETESNASKEA